MSTKADNIIEPRSCWNRAELDEPVFVLRANDPAAPAAVIMWATQYRESKGGWLAMTVEQRQKFYDALDVAQAMRDWYSKSDAVPF
jgi:hypothetical protein